MTLYNQFKRILGFQAELPTLFGDFSVSVFRHIGDVKKRIYRVQKRNQITNDGRNVMLDLLSQMPTDPPEGSDTQQHPEYNQLWSLSVGQGTTLPTIVDSELEDPVWTGVFSPRSTEVAFNSSLGLYLINITKTLGVDDANGYSLSEAGVFTRGNQDDPEDPEILYRRMYARQTFSPIPKTAEMTIEFDWKLGVTVQA